MTAMKKNADLMKKYLKSLNDSPCGSSKTVTVETSDEKCVDLQFSFQEKQRD